MDGSRPLDCPSIKQFLAAIALACALACTGSAGFSQTGAIMIAIAKMTVGAAPLGFEFARTGQGGPGRWAVADVATATGRTQQTSLFVQGAVAPIVLSDDGQLLPMPQDVPPAPAVVVADRPAPRISPSRTVAAVTPTLPLLGSAPGCRASHRSTGGGCG